MTGCVRTESRGYLGFIIFDYEARRNAMTTEMWRAVPAAVARLEDDRQVRVVVMRGAGEVAFVAGADISEFERTRSGAGAQDYDRDNKRAYAALASLTKPLIAMVHGFCVGGGLALSLNADMRYSADDGQFGIPAARLGLGYDAAGIDTLAQLVGLSNAKEILFRGFRFDAHEALRLGLLNRVFPKPELEQRVLAIADEIADNAPLTVRAAKLAAQELSRPVDERDLGRVGRAVRECYVSEDYQEGVKAFLEKRRPSFSGR